MIDWPRQGFKPDISGTLVKLGHTAQFSVVRLNRALICGPGTCASKYLLTIWSWDGTELGHVYRFILREWILDSRIPLASCDLRPVYYYWNKKSDRTEWVGAVEWDRRSWEIEFSAENYEDIIKCKRPIFYVCLTIQVFLIITRVLIHK
jgi:hypothetical protein